MPIKFSLICEVCGVESGSWTIAEFGPSTARPYAESIQWLILPHHGGQVYYCEKHWPLFPGPAKRSDQLEAN